MSKEIMKTKNNAGTAANLEKEGASFTFYNASLGRRILSYLADIFISFILCVFVFEIIYFPITKASIGYDQQVAELKNLGESRYQLYYDNEILYFEDAEKKYNFDADFEYTGDIFTKFYVLKDSVGASNLIEDPIIHFYENVATVNKTKQDVAYMYVPESSGNDYFEPYNPSVSPYLTLKESWVERWTPYFDANDTVSDEIKAEIVTFKALTFKNFELAIISEFSKDSVQYKQITDQMNAIQANFDFYYQIITAAAFLTVFIALFVVTPLVDKHGRTIGKIILRLEVVNNKNFEILRKKSRIAGILLSFLEQLPIILFIPFISVGITEIFTLSILLIFSMVSAVYCLIDVVLALANKLNYSIKELLTRTVVIDRALYDQYYREVVYGEKRDTI